MRKIVKSIFAGCLLVILFLGSAARESMAQSDQSVSGQKVQIVNHRGANRLAPENTYASAKKAIESGASYVEVDVRRSKDGVYYNRHDNRLERTTNGSGLLSETNSEVIDTLDAGSWFSHEYAHERVPRFVEYLQWIKGKAKIFFDMKDVRLDEFIPIIYKLGMEKECFFWFSDWGKTKEFRKLYPDLALKINASSVSALDSLKTIYNPQIIECSVNDLSDEFIRSCHEKGMKVMPHIPGNNWDGYRIAIEKKVDMVNLDNPDVFSNMERNHGVFKGYKLIAHRGGIVGGKYSEYDPASVQAAIDIGYYMLEVDVRETKDGVLLLNHDDNFSRIYNDMRKVNEMTWNEIKKLRAVKGNYRPLTFEELAKMCTGKIRLMIDVKAKDSSPGFYHQLGEIMEKYHLLNNACFIDQKARQYFWGKAKFSIRGMEEAKIVTEKYEKGEDVCCHYFLFDAGKRLTSPSLIRMCQDAYITVVPSVNLEHYNSGKAMEEAKRHIEFLKKCGITEFQIDSDFEEWLPNEN